MYVNTFPLRFSLLLDLVINEKKYTWSETLGKITFLMKCSIPLPLKKVN